MAKKPSGLGRGLGDLFEDNAPEVKTNKGKVVIRKSGDNEVVMRSNDELYAKDKKPKNRSVYLNYKDKR